MYKINIQETIFNLFSISSNTSSAQWPCGRIIYKITKNIGGITTPDLGVTKDLNSKAWGGMVYN